jgi:hypothetical protein
MAERNRGVLSEGRSHKLSSKRIARKRKCSDRMIERGKGSYWSSGEKHNAEEIFFGVQHSNIRTV